TPIPPTPTSTSTASPTPQFSLIEPQNVTNLEKVNQVQQNGAQFFAFVDQGQTFALAAGDKIELYNPTPGLQNISVPAKNIKILATSPDQHALAWANQDNQIRLLNIPQPSQSYTLTGVTGEITSLAFAPSGSQLASASYENQLKLWDTANGQISNSWDLLTSIVEGFLPWPPALFGNSIAGRRQNQIDTTLTRPCLFPIKIESDAQPRGRG
ncbi:MAG: hypothetical protein P8Z00_17835, partial [Anaerolineales bacterium]